MLKGSGVGLKKVYIPARSYRGNPKPIISPLNITIYVQASLLIYFNLKEDAKKIDFLMEMFPIRGGGWSTESVFLIIYK